MTSSRALAAILASLTLAGCFSLPQDFNALKEPKVSLAGLAIQDLNPLQPRFLVRLNVENPNDLAVDLDGADVNLALNGKPVAAGVSRSPLKLAKFGSTRMDVEVTANTLGVVRQIMLLRSQSSIDYAVTGNLKVLNWLGPLGKLPFSFKGAVDRDRLLRSAESLGPLAR